MDEKKKILEMLSNGKITVAEAEQLLGAVGQGSETAPSASAGASFEKKKPRFLRIEVKTQGENGGPGDNVNVRVPFNLLRAGVRLASLMPANVRGQVQEGLDSSGLNLDLSKVKPEDLDQIVDQLADLQVDVDGKDKVKIFVE
jgi:hypothetical protein